MPGSRNINSVEVVGIVQRHVPADESNQGTPRIMKHSTSESLESSLRHHFWTRDVDFIWFSRTLLVDFY
eukprot:1162634-Amphidinium_carterae.2